MSNVGESFVIHPTLVSQSFSFPWTACVDLRCCFCMLVGAQVFLFNLYPHIYHMLTITLRCCGCFDTPNLWSLGLESLSPRSTCIGTTCRELAALTCTRLIVA